MGSPISPADMVAIAKFAWDLYLGCQAASSEFSAVAREAVAMRSILRMMELFILGKPDSILNAKSKEGKQLRNELEEQGARCLRSLVQLEVLLKKYGAMGLLEKLKWATGGKEEVAECQADMASSTTQLNTFFGAVNVWGLGIVNSNVVKLGEKVDNRKKHDHNSLGLDWIEDSLRRHPGDEKKAVKEVMGIVGRSTSREDAKAFKAIISEYANEVERSRESERQGRSKTPEPSKKGGDGKEKRAQSEKPAKGKNGGKNKDTSKKTPKKRRKAQNVTLECWLVKKRMTTETKEKQTRGQAQLEDMAEKFKSSNRGLDPNHGIIRWILEDKNPVEDSRYQWYYVASRVERLDGTILGFGTNEQIMVIIKKQMTPEAQKAADEKEKKEAEKKAAAAKKRKEEKEKADELKKMQKELQANMNTWSAKSEAGSKKAGSKSDVGKASKGGVQGNKKDKKTSPSGKDFLKPGDNSNNIRRTKSDAGIGGNKKGHGEMDKTGSGKAKLDPNQDRDKKRRKSDASAHAGNNHNNISHDHGKPGQGGKKSDEGKEKGTESDAKSVISKAGHDQTSNNKKNHNGMNTKSVVSKATKT